MANNLSWLFCCACLCVCVHIYFIQMADHFMHCVSKKLEKLFHCCCFPNFIEHIRLLSFPPPCSSCWLFIYFIFLWCCIFQWRKTLAAIIFSCLRTSCAPRRVVTLLLTLQTQLRDFMFGSYLLCPCVCACVCVWVAVFQVSRSVACSVLHEYLIVETTDQDVRRIHTHRHTLFYVCKSSFKCNWEFYSVWRHKNVSFCCRIWK